MYGYDELQYDLDELRAMGARVGEIGKSLFGKEIPFVHVGGTKGAQLIITGGIHARENLTSRLVCLMAKHSHVNRDRLGRDGIYYIPMLNPDGVFLCSQGLKLWKANGRGVDLNVNFDAEWGTGISNVTYAGGENYIGEYPLSEPETLALTRFTTKINPVMTLSYHAKGREVYWDFHQREFRARDKGIAEFIAKELNYKLIDGARSSAGGYKDWCVDKLKIPSFTIEIIDDKYLHPLEDETLLEEIDNNLDLGEKLLEHIKQSQNSTSLT